MKPLEELIDEFVINYDFEKYADGIGLSSFQKGLQAIIEQACKEQRENCANEDNATDIVEWKDEKIFIDRNSILNAPPPKTGLK